MPQMNTYRRHTYEGCSLGLIIVKPDAIATPIEEEIKASIARSALALVDQWTLSMSPAQVARVYPIDPGVRPLTFMLHSVCLTGREVRVLLCRGVGAAEACYRIKEQVRAVWGRRIYANSMHTPDSDQEAEDLLGALYERAGPDSGGLPAFPEVWCEWNRADIYEGSIRVWEEAVAVGRDPEVLWAPPGYQAEPFGLFPQAYFGTFDAMVAKLNQVLGFRDLETALRATLAALYDPCGIGIGGPPRKVRAKIDQARALGFELVDS